MCVSTGPAHFSKTKILTMRSDRYHFTAYQNDAENVLNLPNALILPIPGKTVQQLFVDTSAYSNFLEEIVENTKPRSRGVSLGKGFMSDNSFTSFQIGQYSVGLTSSYEGMLNFLQSTSVEKRPAIKDDLLKFFADTYPGWSFAICLFSSTAKMKSQPIAYFYEPFYPEVLFFPTMDAHDGHAPKPGNEVFDHDFIFPISGGNGSNFFSQEVPNFIKDTTFSTLSFHNRYFGNSNGDCYFDLKKEKSYDKMEKTFSFVKEFSKEKV